MKGVINIIGVIGEDVLLQDVIYQVKQQEKATSYTVYIDSVGGALEVGFDIYDYLKSLGKPLETVGLSQVMSIGTVIFLAGDKRVVNHNTDFMIHLPMLFDDSPKRSKELLADAKEMSKVERKIVSFYSEHTLLEQLELSKMLETDTYLTPDELYAFGFTTEKAPLKAVAKLILNTNDKKMSKKSGLLERVKALLAGNVKAQKTLKTADQLDLVFPNVDEDAEPQIGDTAVLDGEPAEGNVTLADGLTYVFEGGVLIEILEEEVSAEFTDDDITALEEKLDEILEVQEALTEVVEEISTDVEDVKEEVVAKLVQMKAKLLKATAGSSQRVSRKAVARRTTEAKENPLAKGINNLKKRK